MFDCADRENLSLARCRALTAIPAHCGQKARKLLPPCGLLPSRYRTPAKYDDIEGGKHRFGSAKHFAHQALTSVSIHGPWDRLAPRYHAKARTDHSVRLGAHYEAAARRGTAAREHRLKLRASSQPI